MTTNDLSLADARFRFICSNTLMRVKTIVREYDLKRNEDGILDFLENTIIYFVMDMK